MPTMFHLIHKPTRRKRKKKKIPNQERLNSERLNIGLTNYHNSSSASIFNGITMANERDEQRLENLSLQKQLKLKCQELSMLTPVYDKMQGRVEMNRYLTQLTPVPLKEPVNPRICLLLPENKAFQAKVIKCMPAGYSLETIIDGKVLHGIVFTSDISSNNADENSKRRNEGVETDSTKLNDNQNSNSDTAKPGRQTFDVPEINMGTAAAPNTNGHVLADAFESHEGKINSCY